MLSIRTAMRIAALHTDRLLMHTIVKHIIIELIYLLIMLHTSEAAKFGTELMHTAPPASGVYEINHVCGDEPHVFHTSIPAMQARCSNGGWTVILRRNENVTQQVNFTCTWDDYKHGFGDLNTEFWYGLNNIHCLTSRQQVDLSIELKYGSGREEIYNYNYFLVDGPENKFTLHVGELQQHSSGLNNMAYHNSQPFSSYLQ